MFFEKYFAIFLVKKKEIIPEIIIVAIINIKTLSEGAPKISLIATAAPVLVLEIAYKERKENPITKVFVAPSNTKKFLKSFFETRFPITAACPLPRPGRKLHKGEAIKELIKGLFDVIFGSFIFCSGIFVLFFILKRYKNIFLLPIIVAAAVGVFYSTIIIQGISIEEIRMQGWLLGPIPEVNAINLALFKIDTVDWLFVFGQVSRGIPALIFVSTIAFLLNINAIEILTKQDIDLNKSLKVTGIANIFSGLCGATVGFSTVDMTSLSYRMNIIHRSLGLFSVLATIIVLFFVCRH